LAKKVTFLKCFQRNKNWNTITLQFYTRFSFFL